MEDIIVVDGVYEPTYIWRGPHCIYISRCFPVVPSSTSKEGEPTTKRAEEKTKGDSTLQLQSGSANWIESMQKQKHAFIDSSGYLQFISMHVLYPNFLLMGMSYLHYLIISGSITRPKASTNIVHKCPISANVPRLSP